MTHPQARVSGLDQAARQNLYNHTLSLPPLDKVAHAPEPSSSAHSPPTLPRELQHTPTHTHSTRLPSPTYVHGRSPPPTHMHLQPASAPHCSDSRRIHDWLQSSSVNSSLDLPLSLKAALKEALSKQPWESFSSFSSPVSPFPHEVDHSWQGLSVTETTASPDHSFNPLTYMVDRQDDGSSRMEATSIHKGDDEQLSESRRESVSTVVGEEQEVDMGSLTGMLKFVTQTLAMQEDPSLWSSTGLSQTQVKTPLILYMLYFKSVNQSHSDD